MTPSSTPQLSVVVPVFNEAGNVAALHRELVKVLAGTASFEIIFVDDGSTDATVSELRKLTPVKIVELARNGGQTTAFAAGIDQARGEWIITIDGDLENDPADIPRLLAKTREGFDVVSGWRKDRWQGQFFQRRFPSWMANKLISLVTGVKLHDHGCSLKIYRREHLTGMAIHGDLHRMLAAYIVRSRGAKLEEIPVSYRPRTYGRSKYGLSRTFKVILDIITFYFFQRYGRTPMHFFGGAGLLSLGLAGAVFAWAVYLRVFEATHFIRTPLPILTAIFVLVGCQFILMGLLAELLLRNLPERYDSYRIKQVTENV